MGLTRTASGLLVRDDFESDTSADYSKSAGTLTVASGTMYASETNLKAAHTSYGTAKCVTVRGSVDGFYAQGAGIWANSDLSSAANVDGYASQLWGTNFYLKEWADNSPTDLGTVSLGTPSGAYVVSRIIIVSGVVYLLCGNTALDKNLNVNDSTYTQGYGGAFYRTADTDGIDWLDLRTAHTITCSGLSTGWYLKVSDGTTTAKAAESSGTATVDAGAVLFPLASVGVYDGDPDDGGTLVEECDTGDYADMGGGDVFAYAGSSAQFWVPASYDGGLYDMMTGGL